MTIIITDEDVKRLLPMRDCVEAMRVAFGDLANGAAVNRPRVRYIARHPDPERKYLANDHVGAVPSCGIACVRAGSQVIRPPSVGSDRRLYENPQAFNWGIVILYSVETAEPLALMHEFGLSGMRVGATTAVAVDQIARADAATLGLFGTGKQARCALEAVQLVRPIRRVNVYSPSAAHRAAFVHDMSGDGIDVVAVDDPRDVVPGADIVNDWESVIENDQTELLDPIKDGVIRREQVHELGDLILGKVQVSQPPRQGPREGIIYYKNNSGLAIQFAAAGAIIYRKALAEGSNKTIPTEWLGSNLSSYYQAAFRPSP